MNKALYEVDIETIITPLCFYYVYMRANFYGFKNNMESSITLT